MFPEWSRYVVPLHLMQSAVAISPIWQTVFSHSVTSNTSFLRVTPNSVSALPQLQHRFVSHVLVWVSSRLWEVDCLL